MRAEIYRMFGYSKALENTDAGKIIKLYKMNTLADNMRMSKANK